ncbi:MAG: hypothetical protein WB973_04525 [Thermoanaerobaculia bacterium]
MTVAPRTMTVWPSASRMSRPAVLRPPSADEELRIEARDHELSGLRLPPRLDDEEITFEDVRTGEGRTGDAVDLLVLLKDRGGKDYRLIRSPERRALRDVARDVQGGCCPGHHETVPRSRKARHPSMYL